MIDEDTINRIADYFEPSEFAEYLGLTTKDLILAFPDEVLLALEDIEELMEFKRYGRADP